MDLSSRCVDLDECVRENDDDTKVDRGGSTKGLFQAAGSQIGFTGRCGKGQVHLILEAISFSHFSHMDEVPYCESSNFVMRKIEPNQVRA